jgi:DNA gyrase/topoisomerase IV subunit B
VKKTTINAVIGRTFAHLGASTRTRPLWETTLDPQVRTLYQVKIEHAGESDRIFETLMGDVVEPRREFIQDNALKVVNLDV